MYWGIQWRKTESSEEEWLLVSITLFNYEHIAKREIHRLRRKAFESNLGIEYRLLKCEVIEPIS